MDTGEDCLFCRIASGSLKADEVYRDDEIVAFRDIDPRAPQHILIIPVRHIASVSELSDRDAPLSGRLINTARKVAASLGMKSYRLVVNCGADAGQAVFHIHLHLMGGRQFGWPPG